MTGVLVTRSAAQAGPLGDALTAAGFEVSYLPALSIDPVAEADIKAARAEQAAPDIALFVSTNAVEFGYAALDLPATVTIGAIGEATATALKDLGATVTITNAEGSNSESLLHHPALNEAVTNKEVLIVRGNGGREVLADTLTERGARVSYVEVYERVVPEVSDEAIAEINQALSRDKIGVVTVLSQATYANLRYLLDEQALDRAAIVTPSPAVRTAAGGLASKPAVYLSAGPDPETLVETVRQASATIESKNIMTNKDSDTDGESADATNDQPDASGNASDTDAYDDTAESLILSESDIVSEPEVEQVPAAVAPPPKKSGRLLGAAALLFSLLALAASAYLTWQNQRGAGSEQLAGLEQQLLAVGSNQATLEKDLKTLRSSLESASGARADVSQRLAAAERAVATRQDVVESLPGRVDNVEDSVAAMQGIAAGTRDNWLKAEAEYYLQLANAQLQLARNPALAAYGLELADERIRQLANPAYTPVRRALASEIQALREISNIDHEGIALRLASLADSAAGLPIRNDLQPQGDSDDDAAADGDQSAWSRGWSATKRVMGKAITVRKADESVTPLLSPEATYFLRTNLSLKFDTARLSLLRGEQLSYEQSLGDAASWIGEYFDTADNRVTAALASIADLSDEELTVELPDISQSLQLLRQQSSLAETNIE